MSIKAAEQWCQEWARRTYQTLTPTFVMQIQADALMTAIEKLEALAATRPGERAEALYWAAASLLDMKPDPTAATPTGGKP